MFCRKVVRVLPSPFKMLPMVVARYKKGQSHVLKAMGLKDKEIEGAIRFSFSEFNTVEEMEYVVDQVKAAVARFRRLGSFR